MKDNRITILCTRIADFTPRTKGQEVPCTKCGEPVHLSDTSISTIKEAMKEDYPDAVLEAVCLDCGLPSIDTSNIMKPGTDQIQELKDLKVI